MGNAQTPCINGMSGEYPCDNVELLSFMDKQNIGGGDMNDIWGWVDPIDSTEYVIIGRTNGTSFINISDAFTEYNVRFYIYVSPIVFGL